MTPTKQVCKTDAWIQTYSGKKFYPYCPTAEMIDIEDVAHALSNICRFTGHSKFHYSVAQHSVHVANCMLNAGYSPKMALTGLLHDASEAYLSDLNTPVKNCLPEYQELEVIVQSACYNALGGYILDEITYRNDIKYYDWQLFLNEVQQLTNDPQAFGVDVPDVIVPIPMMMPHQAKEAFLNLYQKLLVKITIGK